MRKVTCMMLCSILAGSTTLFAAEDEKIPVTVTGDLALQNSYVWRGQVINDEAVLQPAVTATKGGFSLNAWGNFNLTDVVTEDGADFSEIDLTLSYGRTFGEISVGAGYIEYVFPNTIFAATREIYLTCSLPALPIVPAITVNYDFNEADGFYGNFSLSYARSLCDAVSASVFTSLGAGSSDYNNFYFGVDDTALNDFNAGCSLTVKVCNNLVLVPAVQYITLVGSDVEVASRELYKDDSQVVASLKASYSF